jgi:ribose transport system ATP-binding protein
MINHRAMHTKTEAILAKLKLYLDPGTLVHTLKVGQQQVIEIAKALLVETDVIIMDEPTSAISESEVELLFEIIHDLKNENKAIVYISHKLDELFRIADRYIVLRDGKSIEQGDLDGMSHDTLIQKMVGRKITIMRKNEKDVQQSELLAVNNICLKHPARMQENMLNNISFSLKRGEVLGIFGLMGAGRTELLETLFGMHPRLGSGEILLDRKPVTCHNPSAAIKAGLALVPEDRKKDGLVLGLDVKTNICLTMLESIEEMGLIKTSRETSLAKKYIGELAIKTSSMTQAARNLSGGNQQKIVLAKWLATKPKVLMLDEPTRGIDINAKNEIYKLILQLAEEGLGIIVVSSELPEILAISDRILVLTEGSLTAEFTIGEASEENILRAAIPK